MCALFQTTTCCVRLHRPEDFQAILEVYKQSEDFLSLGPMPQASKEMVLADMRHSSDSGGLFCVIQDPSGSTVGVMDFMPQLSQGKAFLELLMISRHHRNRGYGRSVFAALETYLKLKYQTHSIESGVQTNNYAAIRFWKRCGFVIDSKPQSLDDGTVAYAMIKRIDETS